MTYSFEIVSFRIALAKAGSVSLVNFSKVVLRSAKVTSDSSIFTLSLTYYTRSKSPSILPAMSVFTDEPTKTFLQLWTSPDEGAATSSYPSENTGTYMLRYSISSSRLNSDNSILSAPFWLNNAATSQRIYLNIA